ncbi:D-glycero-beta-D-manno-heptose 1,7-bisphosphate 7-phosphatase [Nitratifractor sp.]
MRPALFLDRDGVINFDRGYLYRIEDFAFIPGILERILEAQRRGYLPVIVTNQSGIGRGYYRREDFEALTAWMLERMGEAGIEIERSQVFYCPHTPEEGCRCRKPEPGMLLEAAKRFDLDLSRSWMIGDKASDIQAAKAAGVGHTLQVVTDQPIEAKELHGL